MRERQSTLFLFNTPLRRYHHKPPTNLPYLISSPSGKHTEIIDHHVETADTFYPPGVPVPLEQILEHEARREHLRIYRNRPEKEDQLWVGGMPRFVRAPMHMVHGRDESRNMEMPPGPVLHDTKTGVALRILGSLTPSPEMVVQEAQIGAKLRLATSRWFFYGFLFVTAFFWKFVLYMQLRTKLRSQGIANPILPQNRIKVLEIMYFAREDFAQYKTLFAEFRDVQWIPYRQAKLRAETNMSESAASQLNQDLENLRKNKEAEAAPGWFASLFGGSKGEEEKKSTMAKVFVKELNKTFEVDTSRIVIGMGNAGPVYAPPDAEILQPDQLEEKMRTLKNKAASKLESEMKEWTATSYDDRARVSANEYVVQFHLFLQNKGVITPMDPEKVCVLSYFVPEGTEKNTKETVRRLHFLTFHFVDPTKNRFFSPYYRLTRCTTFRASHAFRVLTATMGKGKHPVHRLFESNKNLFCVTLRGIYGAAKK